MCPCIISSNIFNKVYLGYKDEQVSYFDFKELILWREQGTLKQREFQCNRARAMPIGRKCQEQ